MGHRSGSCLSQRQIEGSLVIVHCFHSLNQPLMVTDGAPAWMQRELP